MLLLLALCIETDCKKIALNGSLFDFLVGDRKRNEV